MILDVFYGGSYDGWQVTNMGCVTPNSTLAMESVLFCSSGGEEIMMTLNVWLHGRTCCSRYYSGVERLAAHTESEPWC